LVTTLAGGDLRVGNRKGCLTINGVQVSQDDMIAENCVLHAVGQVLIPLDDLGNVPSESSELAVLAPMRWALSRTIRTTNSWL
jgi:hypothetical protein